MINDNDIVMIHDTVNLYAMTGVVSVGWCSVHHLLNNSQFLCCLKIA